MSRKSVLPLFALASLVSFTQCSISRPIEVRKAIVVRPAEGGELPLYIWGGDNIPGSLSVTIDLSEQKASIYKGGERVGWTYVATGRRSHPTPTGQFSIIEKKVDKRSNKYGVILSAGGAVVASDATAGRDRIPAGGRFQGASMPYWMRLTNSGVGMHVGPIPNPGSPASHGCIRLPRVMAQTIYRESNLGTPVKIVP